ncbi:prolipoprotein signal peptidase (signal peptidase II) [Denitratisoma oestradiolicum]|uniref:Lipoprotein signal peptidase n=2 Tax=Denitratisoma oestradiolicum TaxID=311182 RepID=A0A6S6XQ15_9PROT|nr:prolipoprotein signal peptidase (signal peptidase II) [Denitratisoma oestradiolicum]
MTMRARLFPWYALAAAVVAADQVTKAWVLAVLRLGEGMVLTPFFNLVLVFNRGAAFSFLASAEGWQRWFFVVLALVISVGIVIAMRKAAANRWLLAALALVLGGALGNVIDRLIYGAVVDFLDFHAAGWHWPAFNLADSAICVGIVLLLWQEFKHKDSRHG